jgi:transglycosylase-like protein with SLT domain
MGNGRRGMSAVRAAALAAIATVCAIGSAFAGDAAGEKVERSLSLPGVAAAGALDVETVFFADRGLAPVRLLRGPRQPPPPVARPAAIVRRPTVAAVRPPPPVNPSMTSDIVSFGNGTGQRVKVIRGGAVMPASFVRPLDPMARTRVERVSFIDPRLPAVTVLRGPSGRDWFSANLFDSPSGGVLDRITFAVEGVESRHGTDLRMWRPEINGPQGPMQVSAAAALDVGGGDRFNLFQNRLLGRAYLVQMYRRYGNWPDALAAYNWGPGNLDQWITGGRRAERLPFETLRYVDIVLRNALVTNWR